MKNQEQGNTKQVLKNGSSSVQFNNENESSLSQIKNFIKRGKHGELKTIIEGLTEEQFKEIIQTHGYNNWNLFHYAANRGVVETLEYSTQN